MIVTSAAPEISGSSESTNTTVIVTVTVAKLPAESTTEYVAWYVFATLGFTLPVYVIWFVKSPSSASVAVIP